MKLERKINKQLCLKKIKLPYQQKLYFSLLYFNVFQCLQKNLLHFSFRTPIFIYESCNLKSSYIYSYAIFISADAFVVK